VVESQAPVITGVGHETDFTLVDFASDLRAPTPTAAAELATPITIFDLATALRADRLRLDDLLSQQVSERRAELDSLNAGLRFYSPARRLQIESQRLDDLLRRAARAQAQRLTLQSAHLAGVSRRLESLSPLAVLRRGYSVLTRIDDGKIVQNSEQAPAGTQLSARLAQGTINVRVQESFSQEA